MKHYELPPPPAFFTEVEMRERLTRQVPQRGEKKWWKGFVRSPRRGCVEKHQHTKKGLKG
jgi:hypothetical protein